MGKRIVIDPITRIQGYLKIEVELENSKVVDAWVSGTLTRGFEVLFKGREPKEAPFLASRVCGLCSSFHQYTSARAIENLYKLDIPDGARLIRNLMLASEFLSNHLMHFYQMALLDYIDITKVLDYRGRNEELLKIKDKFQALKEAQDFYPFTSTFEPDDVSIRDSEIVITLVHHYFKALRIQAVARNMGALFGGRQPHYQSIVVGGVTQLPNIEMISRFKAMLDEVGDFIRNTYIPDVLVLAAGPLFYFAQSGIGSGYNNYLSCGGFELENSQEKKLFNQGVIFNGKIDSVSEFDPKKITESVAYSWYSYSEADSQIQSSTEFDLEKDDAYSFIKAPRYDEKPVEVGPLARLLVSKEENLIKLINERSLKPGAFLRHVARALEAGILIDQMYVWLDELSEAMSRADFKIYNEKGLHLNKNAEGEAFFEAPDGTFFHRVRIKDGKIDDYQIITASTWNASPRDKSGIRGQLEQALIGTPFPDEANPLNILKVVRSFNPCVACATHLLRIDR